MPNPGDLQVNHATGEAEYDDGDRVRELLRAVPLWRCKVRADTGATVTAALQAAHDTCPEGATMLVDGGRYQIDDTLTFSRNINVIFNNAIFDLGASTPSTTFSPGIPENHDGIKYLTVTEREAGTLANRAALIWGVSGTNRPTRNWIAGNLKVERTASANTAAARLHCGIVMLAPFEVRLDFCEFEDFFAGLVLMGGTGQGNVHNLVDNIKATNCRYPLTLYCNRATGGGWANQNEIRGGRLFVSSTIRGDTSYNSSQWEAIRVLYESGGTSPAPPNGNKFGPITIEGEWGRKIRLEGRDNEFNWLRYEDSHPSQTIQILADTDVDNSPSAVWNVSGGVVVTTLATCTASGTLEQPSANFAAAITASVGYKLTYDAVNTGFTGSLSLSGICNSLAGLPITTGSHAVTFSTKASPGDFILTFVRTAGTLTIDNISLTAQPDITIGEVSRTNSFFSRNIFVGGDNLGTILAANNIEFLASGGGNGLNNANTFIGGKANWHVGRVDSGDVITTAHRFGTTSSTAPVIAVCNSAALELIKMHHVLASLSAQGSFEFYDTGGVLRNAFGQQTASPYDFRSLAGWNIANVFRVRIDGTIDAIIANPQTGGQILIPVATGLIKAWAGSSGDDVFVIADSARDARLVLKAQEVLGSGATYLDVIKFYDDDATPTYRNAIGLHPSTSLPGGVGSHPILFEKGIWVNEMLANADSRMSGDTDTDCFYLDASTDRIGIGTSTPDSKLHVVGKIHGTDELELDGVLNHDGASVGFYGAAPVTQPTVTGSRGGNAALASLLTALASQGIIIDSSSA